MVALPTSAGYRDVSPSELITLVTAHKDDKVQVAFTGVDTDSGDCTYTVRWRT